MTTWIVLFRGINVGGKNILPMKELARLLTDNGYCNVRTYIQSGNVVLKSRRAKAQSVSEHIARLVSDVKGFRPATFVMRAPDLEQAISANPFAQAEESPKSLHLYFHRVTPVDPDLEAMEAIKAPGESFVLVGNVFYLYAPDGMAGSRLGATAEKLLGTRATARNWRTAKKVLAMATELN